MKYKGEFIMATKSIKVTGPQINATKEIDISDYKRNKRCNSISNVFTFEKVYTLSSHIDEAGEKEEGRIQKIINSTEYFTPVNKSQIPYTMEPVVNVVIPDIFNHNNGEPIHCNAIVCGLETKRADYFSTKCTVRIKLVIFDYLNQEKYKITNAQCFTANVFNDEGTLIK